MADIKRHFNLNAWRKEKVPFVLCSVVNESGFRIIAFDVEKGSSKQYDPITLTGALDLDRKQIHKLADAIHKDLFDVEGIASSRLVYSQREKKGDGPWRCEIFTSDFDGANGEQITFENDYCVTPCFFPNTIGRVDPSFYFVSYKTGQSKIYRSTLNGKKSEMVFDLGGNQLLPAINGKASQMAFISDIGGRPDLFLQNIDAVGSLAGKPRQIYSAPRATQASPTFSPDGRKIAFVSDKDGPPRIYMMDLVKVSKARPHMLTKKNRENTSPAWSPNGEMIAYSAKVDGVRQIWIYHFDTEEETPLTTGPLNKENPSWASDSLHLVYNTDNEDAGELFLIDLNQKTPVQITKGNGQKRFANFETK
jgi:TolB protein